MKPLNFRVTLSLGKAPVTTLFGGLERLNAGLLSVVL